MSNDNELRDKLARQYGNSLEAGISAQHDFRKGWDAAMQNINDSHRFRKAMVEIDQLRAEVERLQTELDKVITERAAAVGEAHETGILSGYKSGQEERNRLRVEVENLKALIKETKDPTIEELSNAVDDYHRVLNLFTKQRQEAEAERDQLKDHVNLLTSQCADLDVDKANLEAMCEKLVGALEVYANVKNWRDLWKDAGQESKDFKYYYRLSVSSKDTEPIGEPYHFYMGKRARQALADYHKEFPNE